METRARLAQARAASDIPPIRECLLSIGQIVPFWKRPDLAGARPVAIPLPVLPADRALALEIIAQHDPADHLGDQHHADVFSKAFVLAEAEIEVVIPVAIGI